MGSGPRSGGIARLRGNVRVPLGAEPAEAKAGEQNKSTQNEANVQKQAGSDEQPPIKEGCANDLDHVPSGSAQRKIPPKAIPVNRLQIDCRSLFFAMASESHLGAIAHMPVERAG